MQPGGVILGGLAGNSEDPAFRTLIGSPLIDNSDHVLHDQNYQNYQLNCEKRTSLDLMQNKC